MSPAPPPPSGEDRRRVQHTLFQALTHARFQPTVAFLSDLKAHGFDAQRPEVDYPIPVWLACHAVTVRHIFPRMTQPEADAELGRRLALAFFDTLVGKVIRGGLRLAGPARAVRRLQSSFGAVLKPIDMQVEELTPRDWRVLARAVPFPPYAVIGTTEEALRAAGVEPKIELEKQHSPWNFDLRIRWEAR